MIVKVRISPFFTDPERDGPIGEFVGGSENEPFAADADDVAVVEINLARRLLPVHGRAGAAGGVGDVIALPVHIDPGVDAGDGPLLKLNPVKWLAPISTRPLKEPAATWPLLDGMTRLAIYFSPLSGPKAVCRSN